MKKLLIPLLLLLLFCTGCSVGKIIIVEIENEAEGTGMIENKLGSLSTISGDNENTQKDFAKLPFDQLIQLAKDYISKGEAIPESLINAISAKKDDVVIEPEEPEESQPGECVTQLYSKEIMVDDVEQPAYVFEKTGPKYSGGKPIKITFSDKQLGFTVPAEAVSSMYIPWANSWVKYQSGTWDKAPKIKTMEIYAARGSKPESVTACW